MIKKYLITTFRHLRRKRLFTALNIFGLAIGISVCWVIYRIVSYEYSYDKNLVQKEKIYRVVSGFVFDEKESYNGGASKPLYQGIREQMDGLEHVVPVFENTFRSVEVDNPPGSPLRFDDQKGVAAIDSAYFNFLEYRWLSGTKSSFLDNPNSVVLTEDRAKQYFPDQAPNEILDRTITYYSYRDTITRTVAGVVANLPQPTEFNSQEFVPLPYIAYDLNIWTNTNGSDRLYLQLDEASNPAIIAKQVDDIIQRKTKEWRDQSENTFNFKRWIELLPLGESHFATHIRESNIRKASKPVLYGLMGIALFLLVLACINYINMSVAGIPQRTKEIGVRKTLGSNKKQLIIQFLLETLVTTVLAGILSLVLTKLVFWLLKDIIPEGITPFANILEYIGFLLVLSVLVAILAGLYPGWLITRVNAINVFRSTSLQTKGSKGFNLQKALIVFQFVIALVFITSALIIGKQLQYSIKSDMGFNKDAVVLVQVPYKYVFEDKYDGKQFPLLEELKTISGIQNVSLGAAPLSEGYASSAYEYREEGKPAISRQVFKKWVDTSYVNLYNLKVLAGRNLHESDTPTEYVINETAVKAFGFASPQEALGKFIGQKDEKLPIVGVVNDFHMRNFYESIDPMAFQMEKSNLTNFNIKLTSNTDQWQNTLSEIEQKWYRFYPPESFSYTFYDESIEQMYKQEKQLATLVNLATFVSIFISCLGLFGLAVLTAFQRTKEIGIRKVMGASVEGIVRLLSKEYIVLVIIALVFASPIAWFAMDKWLEKFAYRIEIEWWMFLLAGAAAITIALLTVGYQAIKAAIANPVKSLRTE